MVNPLYIPCELRQTNLPPPSADDAAPPRPLQPRYEGGGGGVGSEGGMMPGETANAALTKVAPAPKTSGAKVAAGAVPGGKPSAAAVPAVAKKKPTVTLPLVLSPKGGGAAAQGGGGVLSPSKSSLTHPSAASMAASSILGPAAAARASLRKVGAAASAPTPLEPPSPSSSRDRLSFGKLQRGDSTALAAVEDTKGSPSDQNASLSRAKKSTTPAASAIVGKGAVAASSLAAQKGHGSSDDIPLHKLAGGTSKASSSSFAGPVAGSRYVPRHPAAPIRAVKVSIGWE